MVCCQLLVVSSCLSSSLSLSQSEQQHNNNTTERFSMANELLELIVAQIVGNIATVLFFVLLYYNFLLFEDYFRLIVWAFLLSQALRGAKLTLLRILKTLSTPPPRRTADNTPTTQTDKDISTLPPHLLQALAHNAYSYITREQRTTKSFILDHGIFIFAMVVRSFFLPSTPLTSIINP